MHKSTADHSAGGRATSLILEAQGPLSEEKNFKLNPKGPIRISWVIPIRESCSKEAPDLHFTDTLVTQIGVRAGRQWLTAGKHWCGRLGRETGKGASVITEV